MDFGLLSLSRIMLLADEYKQIFFLLNFSIL